MIAKFGTYTSIIGMNEHLVKCPSCEADSWADVMVSSTYFHIWFLPIFPTEKNADIICSKCGLRRYGVPFNATSRAFNNFQEIKGLYKHKWFTYIGAGILAILFIGVYINLALH